MDARPSTIYYKIVQALYAAGKRPKKGSPFYSEVLAKEGKRMWGK